MTRVYALLLYLYPRSFRRAHGAEVLQFVRQARGCHAWLIADLLRSAPREWYHVARAHRRRAGPTTVHEAARRNRMRNLLHDVRYSARLLLRSPGFSAAAILTLALGIGANTAIFSLADATLLRPLDMARPDRLVALDWSSSYPDYQVYARWHDVFSGTIAVGGATRVSLDVGSGTAELTPVTFVSGNTFDVLGVSPQLGRTLVPSDDVPNGPVVAVLGHHFWKARLGGRRDIVGTTIRANGVSATIVGVAREGFRGISLAGNPSIYFPATAAPQIHTGFLARPDTLTYNGLVWLSVIGRLRDDVTADQAAGAIDALYRQLHPPRPGATMERLTVTPLPTHALGGSAATIRQFVVLLAGVVGLTLLIACANLANLLLVNAAGRRREIGIRLAIGAGRAAVVRQLLTESLLLAVAGGAAGLLVAGVVLDLLSAYQLPGGVAIEGLDLGLNRSAIAAAIVLALLTGLVFGSAPAWRASRGDVMQALRNDSRVAASRSGLRGTLVAIQVALSLMLLTGSALFLRSLVSILSVPLGFEPAGVTVASASPSLARFDEARSRAYYGAALERVRALPGVRAVAWTAIIPTRGRMTLDVTEVEGYAPTGDRDMTFHASAVGPEYFDALGTRVLAGRPFTNRDDESAPPVVIVNDTAARKYWNGGAAVGRRLKVGEKTEWATVVGVVEDTKVGAIDEKPVPMLYWPFDQPLERELTADTAHLLVRSDNPRGTRAVLAEQLRAVDPTVPAYAVRSFEDVIGALVMPQRMGVTLFACFSLLALVLASLGIYGMASHVAALRTREIGIRMALGADRRSVGRLMLRAGIQPVAIGILAGLGLALWAGQLAASFLHGVDARDPVALASVAALMSVVALAANYLPARRAARVDPVHALRHE